MDTIVDSDIAERMTVAAFRAWEPPDGGSYQRIDGVPRASSAI